MKLGAEERRRFLAGLPELLGMELLEASGERVVATMPVSAQHLQPLGYLHGGASVALAESVASIGAWLAAPRGHLAFGMEINANHLRSVRSGLLTATAEPVHQGRSTQVWAIEIRDEAGQLVCISRCSLVTPPERDGPVRSTARDRR